MEAVIASDEESRRLHRELYRCAEETYRIVEDDILSSLSDITGDLKRLHIAASWLDLMRLAAWKADPGIGDLFIILKSAGIKAEHLLPFRDSDIGDLFPWLYYANRVDTLRKICRIAKANAEKHLQNRDTRVYTHLISDDMHRIVASSL